MPDQREPQPTPSPGSTPGGAEEKPHKVDEAAQEEAGRVRKENEGYD